MRNVPDRVQRAAIKLFVERGSAEISISDLAREANVARTTVYKNIDGMEGLFSRIAKSITDHTNAQLETLLHDVDDPAAQLALTLQLPLYRMQEDRLLGLFVTRFALHERELKRFWRGVPTQALEAGVQSGRFDLSNEEVPLALTQMSGALLSVMLLVADGHAGWRAAGRGLAQGQLRALGVAAAEARAIAARDWPEGNSGFQIAV